MIRKEGLLGIAIGAAMALALAAVSVFVKPFGHGSPKPDHEAKRLPPAVQTAPAALPEDFDALCRAAGL